LFEGGGIEFVSVHRFSDTETACDTPYLLPIVFILFDELSGEVQPFSNGDLEGRDTVVVADEVGGNPRVVEVEVGVFACLHSDLQTIFGVINARPHRCTVSLPSHLADFDGGDESGDDFTEGFSGDFVMSGEGGEDSVGRHWGVLVENDGRGMVLCSSSGEGRVSAGRVDGVIEAVVGHVGTKVLDEGLEVGWKPGVWSKDEGWSGLEEAFQGEMALVVVLGFLLSGNRCHLW